MQYAIASIIEHLKEHRDDSPLIDRYLEMGGPAALETQCNMRKGTPVPGTRRRTDGEYEWGNIRIPRNAETDPSWSPWLLEWPYDDYVEAVGWSGWNWQKRQSILFIFDVDADDHEGGLSPEQIKALESPDIPWIEVRRSKGGKGVHWYVWLSVPVDTLNHTEHAQLGAYIRDELIAPALGMAAAELQKLIDKTGYIGWLWHAKAAPNAHELLKPAEHPLPVELIGNWQDHKFLPTPPASRRDGPTAISDPMSLLQQRIRDAGYAADWIAEIDALRIHKHVLTIIQPHYPGDFQTISPGTDPNTANAWVRLADDGTLDVWSWQDEPGWDQSGQFSNCKFGKPSEFHTVGSPKSENARAFKSADELIDGMRQLTGTVQEIPPILKHGQREYEIARKGTVYQARITALKDDGDVDLLRAKSHWWWGAEVKDNSPPPAVAIEELDRHLFFVVQDNSSLGLHLYDGVTQPFAIQSEFARCWVREATGVDDPQPYIDKAVYDYCELTHDPFGPVIQGRKINLACQFRVKPKPGNCDDILSVFRHIGQGIDADVKADPDCQRMGITTGEDYVLTWCGGMVQRPTQPDVGITAHGPGNSAKSTIIDIMRAIIEPRGIHDATMILTKNSQFTGPVAVAVLGLLEEQDCSPIAISNRINDWLTSLQFLAEFKFRNTYAVDNCLHIYQTANDASYAPVFDGDSRFTVIECQKLPYIDPQFRRKIHQQAPAFLYHLLTMELPPPCGRMALPPLNNDAKDEIQAGNRTQAEQFAADRIKADPNGEVTNAELMTAYHDWCRKQSLHPEYSNTTQLTRALSRTMTLASAKAGKVRGERGRHGVTLAI